MNEETASNEPVQDPPEQNPVLRHLGERSAECPHGCPVCVGISFVKQMGPDVSIHLASAARELILAGKALMDSLAEPKGPAGDSKVERIPIG